LYFQRFFPKISITDPVLSSFAGRNPPNPVLAVTSGRPELELDPFNLSLEMVFLRVLLVISGIIFFIAVSGSMSVTAEVLKLKEGTEDDNDDALGILLPGPFVIVSLVSLGVLTKIGRLKLYFFRAGAADWDFVSAITDLGAAKMNDFDDVEATSAGAAVLKFGIDPTFGLILGRAGEIWENVVFIFLGESLSVLLSVSHCLLNGLLLLLFRSNTSGGAGLSRGMVLDSEEGLIEFGGLIAEPKLNTGSVSTFSCVEFELTGGEVGPGGHGGAPLLRSTLLRPDSVTLDFILRLDLVEFTIALSLKTLDSRRD